jgi:hypothetical protein
VLEGEGLSKIVKVISGGRITNGFIATTALRENLVFHVQKTYRANV